MCVRAGIGRETPLSRGHYCKRIYTHLAGYTGILQADAYDGYNKLYLADRKPGPIREAAC